MGFLRRSAPDDPLIHVHGMGSIYGKQVGSAVDANLLGSFVAGRPATEPNLRAARKWLLEANAAEFEWLDGQRAADKGSGSIYEVLTADPLLRDHPADAADVFVIRGDRLVFLRSTGSTVEDMRQGEAEQERATDEAREQERAFRAKQRQLPVRLNLLRETPTLRGAAVTVEELGGRVLAGDSGRVEVTLPERLYETQDAFNGLLEVETRRRAAQAADVLCHAAPVVLAALAELNADRSKSPLPLSGRLPDVHASIGGGVV